MFFFPYFVYLAHLTKFTRGSSLLMEKLYARRKIKSRRKSLVKKKGKKKENRSKEERKRTILVKTRKIPLWKRLVLAELHAGAQISDKEVASNYNLKAVCRFVVSTFSLLSTFCGFPFLPRVLPLPFRNFAHYCAALLNAPMSDRDKKKKCLPWVTFPGKSLSFVIDARINGIYAYRLTGVIMIPHWML